MSSSAGGINKMIVMIPVMLAARKLDGENPNTVQMVRIAYGVVQLVCLLLVVYAYYVASSVSSTMSVYVPPAPTPFADPNAKKKYTQVVYATHVQSAARSLLGSTLFGIAMTCGLHYYKGMLMGLAMQAVMAPLNLWENPLVRSILKGVALAPENTVFDERLSIADLGNDVEIVDDQGHLVSTRETNTLPAAPSSKTISKEGLKTLLLDTWDAGAKADIPKLLSYLSKENVNTQTDPDHWTALMILSGLKQTPESTFHECINLGAKLTMTDQDGWTCLHWAAFHGNETAASVLITEQPTLVTIKDKQQQTPLDIAHAEKSEGVIQAMKKKNQ